MAGLSESIENVLDFTAAEGGYSPLRDLSCRIDGSTREPILLIAEDERMMRPIEELRLQSSIAIILSAPINIMNDTMHIVEEHLEKIEKLNPREESLPERPHATTYLLANEAKGNLINDGWKPVSIAEWRAEGLTKEGATLVLLNSVLQFNREAFARDAWRKAFIQASNAYDQGLTRILDTIAEVAPALSNMLGTPSDFGDLDPLILRHFVENHTEEAESLVSRFKAS